MLFAKNVAFIISQRLFQHSLDAVYVKKIFLEQIQHISDSK